MVFQKRFNAIFVKLVLVLPLLLFLFLIHMIVLTSTIWIICTFFIVMFLSFCYFLFFSFPLHVFLGVFLSVFSTGFKCNICLQLLVMTVSCMYKLYFDHPAYFIQCRILYDKRFSVFHYPVMDEDAPNYRLIIQNPMDMATLLQHVDSGKYITNKTFLEDFDLIVTNAKVDATLFNI